MHVDRMQPAGGAPSAAEPHAGAGAGRCQDHVPACPLAAQEERRRGVPNHVCFADRRRQADRPPAPWNNIQAWAQRSKPARPGLRACPYYRCAVPAARAALGWHHYASADAGAWQATRMQVRFSNACMGARGARQRVWCEQPASRRVWGGGQLACAPLAQRGRCETPGRVMPIQYALLPVQGGTGRDCRA